MAVESGEVGEGCFPGGVCGGDEETVSGPKLKLVKEVHHFLNRFFKKF